MEVTECTIRKWPFAHLTRFAGVDADANQILVIAPLVGGFPILLRDLVLDLLRHGKVVAVTDWFDACYVPLGAGHFALSWKFFVDDGEDPLHFPFSTLALTQMDLPAEHFLENIRCIYQDRDLARNQLAFAGEKIDLAAIGATALMTIEGAEDDTDICCPRSVQIDPQSEASSFAAQCLRPFLVVSWSNLSNACRAGAHWIHES